MVESATVPSIPEFTVAYVDRSYYIQPTYGTDEFSGKTVQKGGGFTVENKTIEVTIKNQPFTPYKNSDGKDIVLDYKVRYKGHFGEYWNYKDVSVDSMSDYSIVTFFLSNDYVVLDGLSPGDKVDFQVQARIGYYTFVPDPLRSGFYHEGTLEFTGESSSWSNTQTLTIGSGEVKVTETTTSPSPSPIQSTPTATPEPTANPTEAPIQHNTQSGAVLGVDWWQIATLSLAVVVVLLVAALVLQRKKGTKPTIKGYGYA